MSDSKKIDYIQDKLDTVADTCANIDKELALQKAAFNEHTKQDEGMYEQLKRMNDILEQNTESLKEHMHRSDLLEHIVEKMDKRLSPVETDFIRKQAVRDWLMAKMKLITKLGYALAGCGTIFMVLKHLLHLLG
jgi:predicted RNase H-like nuclease (RuvC/YqgF family)